MMQSGGPKVYVLMVVYVLFLVRLAADEVHEEMPSRLLACLDPIITVIIIVIIITVIIIYYI